jgi:hypothetical protein
MRIRDGRRAGAPLSFLFSAATRPPQGGGGEAKEQQHEDAVKAAEDWRAVKAYQAAQREAERRSLAGCIAEAHRQNEHDLEHHRKMMDSMHMDFQLRPLDHLEMVEFHEEEKVHHRRSIAHVAFEWMK